MKINNPKARCQLTIIVNFASYLLKKKTQETLTGIMAKGTQKSVGMQQLIVNEFPIRTGTQTRNDNPSKKEKKKKIFFLVIKRNIHHILIRKKNFLQPRITPSLFLHLLPRSR